MINRMILIAALAGAGLAAQAQLGSVTNSATFYERRMLMNATAAQTNTNQWDIATNVVNIATNAVNIATNAIDIATNAIDIAANTVLITTASNGLTAAFAAADTITSNAYVAADTVASNGLTTAFTAADTITSNAYVAADTAASNGLTTAFTTADTATSNGLTTAFTTADTALSNGLIIVIGESGVTFADLQYTPGNANSYANSIALGTGTRTLAGQRGMAIGNSYADGEDAIAIGWGFSADGEECIGIGDGFSANGDFSIAIGSGCSAAGEDGIAIGELASADYYAAISLGYNSEAYATGAVAIGQFAGVDHDYSFAWASETGHRTTADEQFYIYADGGIVLTGGPTAVDAPVGAGDALNQTAADALYVEKADGLTVTNTWIDGEAATQTVYIINGQITAWTIEAP